MSNTKTALAVSICLPALLGCGSTPDQPRAASAAPSCLLSNTVAETCEPQGNQLICPVYVFSTPNGPAVFPYRLNVPRGREARIVWHLLEPRARFLRADGPRDLNNNSEFDQGSPSNDHDGGNDSGANGRKYKFRYKNMVTSATHDYTIFYRSGTGQEVSCHPTITNNAD